MSVQQANTSKTRSLRLNCVSYPTTPVTPVLFNISLWKVMPISTESVKQKSILRLASNKLLNVAAHYSREGLCLYQQAAVQRLTLCD